MKPFLIAFIVNIIVIPLSYSQSFKALQNPVIAHRGAWKSQNLPENSVAALKQAINLGCYGTEFDVWLTADEVVVLNHDPDFMGMDIESSTYAMLLSKTLPNGEHIPTLEQYLLEGRKQYQTKLILEAKPSKVSVLRSIKLAEACINLVQKHKMQDWMEYISFSWEICETFKRLQPQATVSFLDGLESVAKLKSGNIHADYNQAFFKKNPQWIKTAKDAGIILNTWTVNKREDMQWMLSQGIDFITTNEPELLFKVWQAQEVKP